MAVMELKEQLDFQALMAIPGFLDHLYVARSLNINSNGIVYLQICSFSVSLETSLNFCGAASATPCPMQESVLAAP
jgi:hypothetical protein